MSPRMTRYASLLSIMGACFLVAAKPKASDTKGDRSHPEAVCAALTAMSVGNQDAAPTLQHCLDSAVPGERLGLPAGTYLLRSPIFIRKSIVLATAGLTATAAACRAVDARCATLMPVMSEDDVTQAPMPVNVEADGVTIDHLIFAGTRATAPQEARALCLSQHTRSLAGGVRWNGENSRVLRSVFRDFPCYSAFEFGTGSGDLFDNLFFENGTHDAKLMWSDGLTVHDGRSLAIRGNRFIDNTDVQLIFGSCIHCLIKNNVFRHSGKESGGSFAELMIHAWPGGATSGRYDDTIFSGNDIDCGAEHRCGFGIMVGALPWYQAPTSGGKISGNRVRNAMLGINVDGLTGPVIMESNTVTPVPGDYHATCGTRRIDRGINIAPSSRRYVANARTLQAASEQSFANCLLNYSASAM